MKISNTKLEIIFDNNNENIRSSKNFHKSKY